MWHRSASNVAIVQRSPAFSWTSWKICSREPTILTCSVARNWRLESILPRPEYRFVSYLLQQVVNFIILLLKRQSFNQLAIVVRYRGGAAVKHNWKERSALKFLKIESTPTLNSQAVLKAVRKPWLCNISRNLDHLHQSRLLCAGDFVRGIMSRD